jgi:predicted RNA-binding Zn ribbon-like protein
VTPDLLLRLANLEVARKPGRGPIVKPDSLASAERAADALGVGRVEASDLVGLRALHELVVELVELLLAGRPLDEQVSRLNVLARPSSARARLEITAAGEPREQLDWTDPTLVAGLARQVVLELGSVDRARLRRCARRECDLLFYDTTRSNTRRWHAESPCGQRERQRRSRAAQGAQAAGDD